MGCSGRRGLWGREMRRFGSDWKRGRRDDWSGMPSSGNHAFDEYREETLKRLEAEQKEFNDYLERLRMAKDKAEFEQFMNERRKGSTGPAAPTGPSTGSGPDAPGFESGIPGA